jgi:hypothetical protein
MPQDHWLPGFNFNVKEWDAQGQTYETLAICRTLALARAVFAAAIITVLQLLAVDSTNDTAHQLIEHCGDALGCRAPDASKKSRSWKEDGEWEGTRSVP